MGRTLLLGALLAVTLLTPAAASAADVTITVGPQKTLSPPSAAVNPDDTVHWVYASGSIEHHIRSINASAAEVWDFGRASSGDHPHKFLKSGAFAYHCELHPNDMFGTITVSGMPVAQLAVPAPAQPFTDQAVSFDASATTDPDGTIDSYGWDWDANGTIDATTLVPTATHAYATAAAVTARVTVTDNRGNTQTATRGLTVRSRIPTAAFTATPGSVAKGQAVALDGTGSSDLDGTISTFEWDLGNGAGFVAGTSTNSVSYTTAGTKTVLLRVTDNDGRTAQVSQTVTVSNQAPTAALTASTTTPANGADVTLNAGTSADPDGTIASYAWDLDGNNSFETPGGATPTITHKFTTGGPVTVHVQVTDNEGGTATAAVTLTVAAPPTQPGTGLTTTPTQTTTPASTTPVAVPGLTPPTVGPTPKTVTAPAAPAGSVPSGQRLKRQRGVKVAVSCGAACQLVLEGTVKVGGKRLRLTKLARALGAGQAATLILGVDKRDLKLLRKARGKANGSIKMTSTSGGQTVAQSLAVSLTS